MFSAGIKSARKARKRHAVQIFVELFEYPSGLLHNCGIILNFAVNHTQDYNANASGYN